MLRLPIYTTSTFVISLFLSTVACQQQDEPQTEKWESAIIGGESITPEYESVCQITIPQAYDGIGVEPDDIVCTGTLVGDRLVLTSASCLYDYVNDGVTEDISIGFGQQATTLSFTAANIEMHRYYDPDESGRFDLAFIELDSDYPGTPPVVALNTRALSSDDIAQTVTLVGFGETGNDFGDFGTRRKLQTSISTVSVFGLFAGSDSATTCAGDSGGPVFADLGDGEVLIAVNALQDNCFDNINRTRVDVYTADFLFPYIDRFGDVCGLDGICGPDQMPAEECPRTDDPDCEPCAWNGVCETDCPTRDWDCELGSFAGTACSNSGECEQGGQCFPAVDDETFTFCTRVCDPDGEACPSGMTCQTEPGVGDPQCVWLAPSPGSQGYSCSFASECRSGICEETICVTECDPSDANACPDVETADGTLTFSCLPSTVEDGVNVCQGLIKSGGGGFGICQSGGESPLSLFAILVAIALAVGTRRRRVA